jgi:hypothetical protein
MLTLFQSILALHQGVQQAVEAGEQYANFIASDVGKNSRRVRRLR